MRWQLVAAALFLIGANANAQRNAPIPWYRHAHSWTLYEENDAFATSDSTYTQGLRVSWNYAAWNQSWARRFSIASLSFLVPGLMETNKAIRECSPLEGRDGLARAKGGGPCGSFFFGIGQTMYTPSDLTLSTLDPAQRPYAGYLWASYGLAARYSYGVISTQLQLGTTGPPSLARDAQSLAHWTWANGSPQPQGWANQLKASPQLALVNQYSGRPPRKFFEQCLYGCNGSYTEGRWYDITPRAQLDLGLPMTRASGGGVLRVGYRFPDVLNGDRIPVSRARSAQTEQCFFDAIKENFQPWFMAFLSGDGRAVAANQLLSGTFADRGANGWHTIKQIDTNHLTWESSWGLGLGSNYATLIFQKVSRGAEYHPRGGTHHYGALSFTIHSPPPGAPPRPRR